MKKTILASAALATLAFTPTSAFANYYTWLRCLDGGGNYFTCLGDLLTDDGTYIVDPGILDEFGFLKEAEEKAVLKSVEANSKVCDEKKGKDRAVCYLERIKKDLSGKK